MMIQRNSDTGMAPDWFLSAGVSDKEVSSAAGAQASMNRDEVVAAKTRMEECARNGERFFVNEELDPSVRSELSEYAQAVGLPDSDIKNISDRQQQSYAAVEALSGIEQEAVETKRPDPMFDIGPKEATDPSHFQKSDDWEKTESSSKLGNRPDPNSGIVPIRGAESVETSRIVGNRPGENSMAAPNAIKELAETEAQSSRDKIVAGNEERKSDISFDKTNWEAEAVAGMSEAELPRAGIMRTESPQSQNHSSTSPYKNSISQDGCKDAPDQTMGETIAERNAQKRAEIQRQKGDEREWDSTKSSIPEKVSDIFTEELEKRLNGNK